MSTPGHQPPPKTAVFWILWIAILTGLPLIYLIMGQSSSQSSSSSFSFPLGLIAGLPPLLFSIVNRWAILPRIDDPSKALIIFVMGMALAEGCGIIGIILGGEHKNLLFAAGMFGVLQYIPLFAGRFGQESPAPPHTKVVK